MEIDDTRLFLATARAFRRKIVISRKLSPSGTVCEVLTMTSHAQTRCVVDGDRVVSVTHDGDELLRDPVAIPRAVALLHTLFDSVVQQGRGRRSVDAAPRSDGRANGDMYHWCCTQRDYLHDQNWRDVDRSGLATMLDALATAERTALVRALRSLIAAEIAGEDRTNARAAVDRAVARNPSLAVELGPLLQDAWSSESLALRQRYAERGMRHALLEHVVCPFTLSALRRV